MSNRFKNNAISQNVTRFLLFLQIGAVVTALGLSLLHLFSSALAISFLIFIVLIAILHWLYLRYQGIPTGQKKRELERAYLHWQQKIRAENLIIQNAKKKREELLEAEKNEINSSLNDLQQGYIQSGLANTFIQGAAIPGVGADLEAQLADLGILSAAQVSSNVSEMPCLEEAQRQALVSWRNIVFAGLDNTKPDSLPREQLDKIKQNYQLLHEQNNTTALDAEARSILWNICITQGFGNYKRP